MTKFLDQNFRVCAPLYQTDDGQTTSDIKLASVDSFGALITYGYDSNNSIPHNVYSPPKPISFNPADPTARQRAFELRSAFDGMTSQPNIYGDGFEVMQYVNSVASQVFQRLKRSDVQTQNTNSNNSNSDNNG